MTAPRKLLTQRSQNACRRLKGCERDRLKGPRGLAARPQTLHSRQLRTKPELRHVDPARLRGHRAQQSENPLDLNEKAGCATGTFLQGRSVLCQRLLGGPGPRLP